MSSPGRILGIGGIFFKSANQPQLSDWYRDKLGIDYGPYGATFNWRSIEEPVRDHLTTWSIFPKTSDYFAPSESAFMINYIVDDMDAFLAKAAAAGVSIDPKREDHEYGRFAWIFDADGNKIELWEPAKSSENPRDIPRNLPFFP